MDDTLHQVKARVTDDNSDGLRRVASSDKNLRREVNINLALHDASGPLTVHAWGSAFPADGGAYVGKCHRNQVEIDAAVEACLSDWRDLVIEAGDDGKRPFVDHLDPGAASFGHDLQRELARTGFTLYQNLFGGGDDRLAEISAGIRSALSEGSRVVAFHSEEVLAPWGMIYTPTNDEDDVFSDDYKVDPKCFWGYSHILEHQFRRVTQSPEVCASGETVVASLNVDNRIESSAIPFVESVERVFAERRVDYSIRTRKQSLATAVRSSSFKDQIMYFGCHGHVVRSGPNPLGQLTLADDKPIRSSDVHAWLVERLMSSQPVIVVNACRGGKMASPFYTTFARDLLRYGANCLLGPQIDVPIEFAAHYATELFARFLKPGTRLGPLVRDLAQHYWSTHHNPLALTYGLYRGIDAHIA